MLKDIETILSKDIILASDVMTGRIVTYCPGTKFMTVYVKSGNQWEAVGTQSYFEPVMTIAKAIKKANAILWEKP